MATASRNTRKIRRIKRERTLAYRMYRVAAAQRDQVISMYNTMLEATKKVAPPAQPEVSIVRLPDDDNPENNPVGGQNPNDNRLEVPEG